MSYIRNEGIEDGEIKTPYVDYTSPNGSVKITETDTETQFETAGSGVNTETLSGNKVLISTDKRNQHLNPDGANRTVTLGISNFSEGASFTIRNTGAYNANYYLHIKQGMTALDKIFPGGAKTFIFNGLDWIGNSITAGDKNDNRKNTHVGAFADGSNEGVGIGFSASSGNKKYSFAAGAYSECIRENEMIRTGESANQHLHGLSAIWHGATSDDQWHEIFSDGNSVQFNVLEGTGMTMLFSVVGIPCDAGVSLHYAHFMGIADVRYRNEDVVAVGYTEIHNSKSDANIDFKVEADTITSCLKISVRGYATTAFSWTVTAQWSEIRCPVI